eukprot:19571-Chlamydomonas_euryale.AAC.4
MPRRRPLPPSFLLRDAEPATKPVMGKPAYTSAFMASLPLPVFPKAASRRSSCDSLMLRSPLLPGAQERENKSSGGQHIPRLLDVRGRDRTVAHP